MSEFKYEIKPISSSMNRDRFDCGVPEMNKFLRNNARQSHDKCISRTYCAVDSLNPNEVLGFFTVLPTVFTVKSDEGIPAQIKKLGGLQTPGFKLGRLAVDKKYHKGILGKELFFKAVFFCAVAAELVGGAMMFIDAKAEKLARWYETNSAVRASGNSLFLWVSLKEFKAQMLQDDIDEILKFLAPTGAEPR